MLKEHYRAQPMAVDGLAIIGGAHVGGFLAKTAGTISVLDNDGTTLVDAVPVAVGFNRIPILFNTASGGTVQLGGGASGTLLL